MSMYESRHKSITTYVAVKSEHVLRTDAPPRECHGMGAFYGHKSF